MKVIVNVVALALSLAMYGTSSNSVYMHELCIEAVVSSQFKPFHQGNQTFAHSFSITI